MMQLGGSQGLHLLEFSRPNLGSGKKGCLQPPACLPVVDRVVVIKHRLICEQASLLQICSVVSLTHDKPSKMLLNGRLLP